MLQKRIDSESELEAFAQTLAPKIKPGQRILLEGSMGAGKTTFTRALAKALNIQAPVTSPTFVRLQIYPGVLPLIHFDFYQIESLKEIVETDLIEILESQEGVIIVEWWDRFPELFRQNDWRIRFVVDQKGRILEYSEIE